MTHPPLTGGDVIILNEIVRAAYQSAHVRWLDKNDNIRTGIARHIVNGEDPSDWGFLRDGKDIRDAFLRITTTDTGTEMAEPVSRLMELVREGGFIIEEKA